MNGLAQSFINRLIQKNTPPSNGVFNYLDCSTAHITPDDDLLLMRVFNGSHLPDDVNHEPFVFGPSYDNRSEGCGHWLYAGTEDGAIDAQESGVSDSLYAVMRYAEQKNCLWIRLSPDGHLHEDLATYVW